ncbi:MAG: TonB-dependent receptor, partial [Deltaproteobacteria bacterium]|nr:TonB-dependent receptor [Deltaproteobacteria bacterium]
MFTVKKRNKISCYWLVPTLILSLLFAPNVLFSEEEFSEDFLLEEVTVTASRRTQEIQDVANSITALEMDTIKETRIRSLQDIMELVPNAVLEPSAVGDNQVISIRGVRQAPARISEPAFGLYRNGAYFGGARTNIGTLIDLERVEILRGPQGGLYGRNAVAGTVNLIYATPTDRLEGNISAMYGSFDRTEFEGVLNVPVVENKFALRAVGWHHNQDEGEFFNAYLHEYIDQKQDVGGRLSARWDVTPNLEVLWNFEMQEAEGPEVMAYFKDFGETKKTIMRDTPSLIETEFTYFSQDINWDTKIGILQLAATYREYELDGIGDQDFLAPPNSPIPPFPFLPFPANLAGVSQQIINRFDDIEDAFVEGRWISNSDQPITWVAGLTYFDEDLISNFRIDLNTLIPDPVFGGVGTGSINSEALIKTESLSAWGEVTWAVSDKLDLIGSLRYSRDEKELNYASFNLSNNFIETFGVLGLPPIIPLSALVDFVLPPLGNVTSSDTFEQWSPGIGARYEFSSNLSVYARINTGFRAG